MGFDFLDFGFPKSGTDWKSINGKPFITVSAKGRSNGLSNKINDGADFGPDTTLNASSPNQTGPPYTQTVGIQEALNYASNRVNTNAFPIVFAYGAFHISSNIYIPSWISLIGAPFNTWANGPDTFEIDVPSIGAYTVYIGTSSSPVQGVLIANISFQNGNVYTNCGETLIKNCAFNRGQLLINNTSYASSASAFYPFEVENCTFNDSSVNPAGLVINTPNGIYKNLYFIQSGAITSVEVNSGNIYFENIFTSGGTYGIVSNSGGNTFINCSVGSQSSAGMWLASGNGTAIRTYQGAGPGNSTAPLYLIETSWNDIELGIGDLANAGTVFQLGTASNPVGYSTFRVFEQNAQTALVTVFDIVNANGPLYFEGTLANTNSNITMFNGTLPLGSLINIKGYTPTITTPTMPTSGTAQQNSNAYPVNVYLYGGTVTEIQITKNGTAYTVFSNASGLALSGQVYKLNPSDEITITYTSAPTWEWLSD